MGILFPLGLSGLPFRTVKGSVFPEEIMGCCWCPLLCGHGGVGCKAGLGLVSFPWHPCPLPPHFDSLVLWSLWHFDFTPASPLWITSVAVMFLPLCLEPANQNLELNGR